MGWPGPPAGWEYESSWDACNDAPGKASMIDFYRNIAPRLTTTIVFNGDVDPCVSDEGTRTAIERVGFAVKAGGEYRPWFYNKTAATVATLLAKPPLYGPNLELHDAGAQFGGQVVNYEHNLSFATVHGSGHMVPQFRPQSAERLLNRLLTGSPFTPLLATDKELGAMSDSQFDTFVDKWTVDAKSSAQPECAAHPKCAGLSGACCPTAAGVTLACCKANMTMPPPPPPSKTCAAHPKCTGLSGDCCPTAAGVTLACCKA